jgi:hypothetical protein
VPRRVTERARRISRRRAADEALTTDPAHRSVSRQPGEQIADHGAPCLAGREPEALAFWRGKYVTKMARRPRRWGPRILMALPQSQP